jgi:hypothetical protein
VNCFQLSIQNYNNLPLLMASSSRAPSPLLRKWIEACHVLSHEYHLAGSLCSVVLKRRLLVLCVVTMMGMCRHECPNYHHPCRAVFSSIHQWLWDVGYSLQVPRIVAYNNTSTTKKRYCRGSNTIQEWVSAKLPDKCTYLKCNFTSGMSVQPNL